MYRLPAHMHNVHNRTGCGNVLERSLRDTQYQKAGWIEHLTMAEGKKSYRLDPNGSPKMGYDPNKPQKKKMTFTELLIKFGYITADKKKD